MPLKRTMVYADADDLAAMRVRRHAEPLPLRRYASDDPMLAERVDEILLDDGGEGVLGAA